MEPEKSKHTANPPHSKHPSSIAQSGSCGEGELVLVNDFLHAS